MRESWMQKRVWCKGLVFREVRNMPLSRASGQSELCTPKPVQHFSVSGRDVCLQRTCSNNFALYLRYSHTMKYPKLHYNNQGPYAQPPIKESYFGLGPTSATSSEVPAACGRATSIPTSPWRRLASETPAARQKENVPVGFTVWGVQD